MTKREFGFFYGLGFLDGVRIALAFLFAMAGFYLGWRVMFGPPLFGSVIQKYTKTMQVHKPPIAVQTKRPSPQSAIPTTPGEVSVGIAPVPAKNRKGNSAQPNSKPKTR